MNTNYYEVKTRIRIEFDVYADRPLSRDFLRRLKKEYKTEAAGIFDPIYALTENRGNMIRYVACEEDVHDSRNRTFKLEKV